MDWITADVWLEWPVKFFRPLDVDRVDYLVDVHTYFGFAEPERQVVRVLRSAARKPQEDEIDYGADGNPTVNDEWQCATRVDQVVA